MKLAITYKYKKPKKRLSKHPLTASAIFPLDAQISTPNRSSGAVGMLFLLFHPGASAERGGGEGRGGGHQGRGERRTELRTAEGDVEVLKEAVEGRGDHERDTDVQGPVLRERMGILLSDLEEHRGVSIERTG